MKKILSMMLVVVMAAVVFAGCSKPAGDASDGASAPASKLEEIKKKGKIVLGTSADYAPFEFHKMIDGKDQIVGFEIEIAKSIAKDLGVELQIVDMDFDGLIPAMMANKVDFIISGMNPTDERKKNVDFSNDYYEPKNTIIVKGGTEGTFKTVESLKGKKVGVQKGSTQEAVAREIFKESELISIARIPDLVLQLKTGKLDGVVVNNTVGENYSNNNDDIKLSGIDLGSEGVVAVAVSKGETALTEVINKSIQKIKESKEIDKFIVDANDLANTK